MNLDLAATFVRVVEAGSFTAAARRLGVPKSSVSRSVARLEESLGVSLLSRTTRRLNPTAAGQIYFEHAARALNALADGERGLAELQGEPRGRVRLTAPVDLEESPLADSLLAFSRENPLIAVECVFTNRALDLAAESVDLALRASAKLDPSLVARKLGDDDHWLVAAPSYLAKRRPPRTPSDLRGHECVLFRPVDGRESWHFTGSRGSETIEVTGRLAADDFAFVRRLALAGAGITLLPSVLVLRDLEEGNFVRLLPDWQRVGAALHLVIAAGRNPPRRVALLRDHLVEQFGGGCFAARLTRAAKRVAR
jgi:DNA-binding transcriptional LysR family regulator